MSEPEQEPLSYQVHPLAKRNGMVFCCIGVGTLCLALLLNLTALPMPWQVWVVMLSFAGIFLLLGIGKLIEPEVSLVITPQHIRYLHRRGQWQIPWEAIIRFDIPRVSKGFDYESLPYIGIRLEDEDALLAQISPRLAVHLIHEQRHLLAIALRRELPAQADYSDYFDIPTQYVSRKGIKYTGVKAVFATRMQQLRSLLGYDLYVNQTALDRPVEEFCQHLQRLRATRPPTP